jgi:outer membrane protein OmpA-like peptidoglycan-associated protein
MSAPPTNQPRRDDTRTGAIAVGERRRRPAWLIPLLAVALLALLLLALAFLLFRGADDDKKASSNRQVDSRGVSASTPGGLPPSAAAAGTVPSSATGTSALPATPSTSASPPPSTPTADAGTAGGSAPAALVGGGGIAAQPAAASSISASASGDASTTDGAGTQGGTGGQMQGVVLFATGSATLDSNAKQVVSAAANRIKAQHPSQVTVSGYTDNVGRQDSNAPLSQARAAAVAAALRTELGPGGPTVSANGRGWSDFVASNASESGRQQNRRASITS